MTGFRSKRNMSLFKMSDEAHWGLDRIKDWKLILCILPKTCALSGKKLWGRRCYKGTRVITGPDHSTQDDYFYIEQHEFMIWLLTGKK